MPERPQRKIGKGGAARGEFRLGGVGLDGSLCYGLSYEIGLQRDKVSHKRDWDRETDRDRDKKWKHGNM